MDILHQVKYSSSSYETVLLYSVKLSNSRRESRVGLQQGPIGFDWLTDRQRTSNQIQHIPNSRKFRCSDFRIVSCNMIGFLSTVTSTWIRAKNTLSLFLVVYHLVKLYLLWIIHMYNMRIGTAPPNSNKSIFANNAFKRSKEAEILTVCLRNLSCSPCSLGKVATSIYS